jgi:hypothetical protein
MGVVTQLQGRKTAVSERACLSQQACTKMPGQRCSHPAGHLRL